MKLTLGQFFDPLKSTVEGSMWIGDVEECFGAAWEQARALELTQDMLTKCVLLIVDAIRADVHRACSEERYTIAVEDGRTLLAAISQHAVEQGFQPLLPELVRAPLSYAEDFEQAGIVEIVDDKVIVPEPEEMAERLRRLDED